MMRVLWVVTKAPDPVVDGGRLAIRCTVDALAAAGADLTLVGPASDTADVMHELGARTVLVTSSPAPWAIACWRSVRSGRPISIERHASAAVWTCVTDLMRRERFDVVHVEQLQAHPNALLASAAGAALVLRAQNVESDIWIEAAARARFTAPALRFEARRLRRYETVAVRDADLTIALSTNDAQRLSALHPAARVLAVPPPAPHVLPPGARLPEGDPAFTWIGSRGWLPNEDATAWLLGEVWPAVSARLPAARLHAFGVQTSGGANVILHPPPRDSADAFASEAILLLPLRIAAGVRMRVLEAWSRAVPVIASPAAVEGLETTDGDDVLIARDAAEFAHAAGRLAADSSLRTRLREGGRAALARRHDPAKIAQALLAAYEEASERRRARGRRDRA
jgi:hypothetical protein